MNETWLLASASFAFGAASSLHCAAMCGPLAACFASRGAAALGYHAARLGAYTLLGALAGLLGASLPAAVGDTFGRVVPLVFALIFVGSIAGVWPRLPFATGLTRRMTAVAKRASALPEGVRGAALGAVTPLLPCATFAGMLALAFASGGPRTGAVALAAFGAASLPLLLLVQVGAGAISRWIPASMTASVRRGLLALSALLVVTRAASMAFGPGCH